MRITNNAITPPASTAERTAKTIIIIVSFLLSSFLSCSIEASSSAFVSESSFSISALLASTSALSSAILLSNSAFTLEIVVSNSALSSAILLSSSLLS